MNTFWMHVRRLEFKGLRAFSLDALSYIVLNLFTKMSNLHADYSCCIYSDMSTADGPRGASTFMSFVDGKGGRECPLFHSLASDCGRHPLIDHCCMCAGHSVANAYLTPSVLARPNLTISVNTYTEKIIFSTTGEDSAEGPRAIGVQVSQSRDGRKWRVKAAKEVIVCCGTSPNLNQWAFSNS